MWVSWTYRVCCISFRCGVALVYKYAEGIQQLQCLYCSTESCVTLFQETDCKGLAKLTPHTDKHCSTIYKLPILSLWLSV